MPTPIVIAKNARMELALLPAGQPSVHHGGHGHGQDQTLQNPGRIFSRIGTPVFMADVMGDLTGISQAGGPAPSCWSG